MKPKWIRRQLAAVAGLLASKAVSFSIRTSLSASSTYTSASSPADAPWLTNFLSSECDDTNTPPSLSILVRSIRHLESGSDIRGQFVDHSRVGSIANVAYAIGSRKESKLTALTPFAAYCLGHAFAQVLRQQHQQQKDSNGNDENDEVLTIALGRDPRDHGVRLADAFSRGALSVERIRVVYTGIATTPAMFEFCRQGLCDAGVMVTASHLPVDRNGFKFFGRLQGGGFSKSQIQQLCHLASIHASTWQDAGILPPSSGKEAVFCSEWVNFMPIYAATLRDALLRECQPTTTITTTATTSTEQQNQESDNLRPLQGLRIVLNAGHGSGGFFQQVLQDLGADVSASVYLEPDASFPVGVPNPEYSPMIQETMRVCQQAHAHLGIMLDTDADRCGVVVPRTVSADGSSCADYEVLNRNRLIAVLAVIFAETSPGCAIVTDSVTSEGLAKFLTQTLGLQHIRYLKGYANVIAKAKEVTERGIANAKMAIETSGHCAMQENGFLDDGTYTAVKVVGLLARTMKMMPQRQQHDNGSKNNNNNNGQSSSSLLDCIAELEEMPHVQEVRLVVRDGSLETTQEVFDFCALEIERMATTRSSSSSSSSNDNNNDENGQNQNNDVLHWTLDRDNLEGIRVRTGTNGGFFMLRKSLHDPIISLQVEAASRDHAKQHVMDPLWQLFQSDHQIVTALDLRGLQDE